MRFPCRSLITVPEASQSTIASIGRWFGFGVGTGWFPDDSQTGRLTATPAMQRAVEAGQTGTQIATTGARNPFHPGRDIHQKALGDRVVTVDV